MKYTGIIPESWKDLQDCVSKFFNEAGYVAMTPYNIETVRGKVEVDVYVEAPNEIAKKIICECKYWNTPVPKEKVHAFRTVVYDSGATLGMLISKNGFQSGAIDAAKCSNVILLTWEEFINTLSDKWLTTQLKKIKKISAPLSVYLDPLDFPFERLREEDKERYLNACNTYSELRSTCWMVKKSDLINDEDNNYCRFKEFSAIDKYLEYLLCEVKCALREFETILDSSNISIPEYKFEESDAYLYMFLE